MTHSTRSTRSTRWPDPPRITDVRRRALLRTASACSLGAACGVGAHGPTRAQSPRTPDVGYAPTPEPVADAMLRLARVEPRDRLYDLGAGDGRIAIMAARRFGARAVGVELDAARVLEARAAAARAGVADRVRFEQADLFQIDLTPASVVTLYLLPALNLRLRPTLQALAPGTRIVSHGFDMGDWMPERTRVVEGRPIHLWTVGGPRGPARAGRVQAGGAGAPPPISRIRSSIVASSDIRS